MNYPEAGQRMTRTTEHKHFAPWECHDGTVVTREYPRACGPQDIPYYPLRLAADRALADDYAALAGEAPNVTFAGRLGTYRYLDMDVTLKEALTVAQAWLAARRPGRSSTVYAGMSG